MSESLETLRGNLVEVLNDQNTRYRGEIKLSQLHRNEWPKLWEAIDALVAWWPGDDDEGDLSQPEVPMVAEFDENDELVGMETLPELPDIPEPGEEKRDQSEEFSLPENPE